MGEAKPSNHTSMVTKPSTNRKPLSNLTNTVRNPNHTPSSFQSKKPVSSTASDSSIGSTQNPINKTTADHLVGVENQTVQGRRRSSQNTRSKTTATVPLFQASSHVRKNNVKEGSVSFCSSTPDKFKNQEKISRFCLDKTSNDGKQISVAPRNSSTENTNNSKDNRKSTDVPLSGHPMKNVINSTKKDKGKENVVPSAYSLKGNANSNTGLTMPDSLMKRKDKGKAIAEPIDYPSRKKLRNSMMEFSGPLKGVVIKEKEDTVTGSGSVSLVQKDKGKGVSTPINYHALEKKKDQQSSCPPILRTTSNRGIVDGMEDAVHSKLQTEPPPNKKKRRCPTKEIDEEYSLPQEYVEQQRAYFKEIDDFELEVEEV